MSYEKQTWQKGDVITADKLNHMENGIDTAGSDSGSALFVIELKFISDESNHWFQLVTPFADIQQAYSDGKVMIVKVVQEFTGECMYTLNNLSYGVSYDELTGIQCAENTVSVYNNTINMYYEKIVIASDGVTSTVSRATLDGTIMS